MDGSVITIGTFDGVHTGHRALLRAARELAGGAGARVVAMAFDPHPLTRLRPEAAPPRLTTFDRRAALLREAGADEVVRLDPTPELLAMTPEEFVEQRVRPHRPVAVVEGRDFRFGRGRAGNVETLRALGRGLGFDVRIVEPVEVALSDHTIVTASSSIVRWLVGHGRVFDAARVLGRPHELAGTVVPGDRRGREIGYPTANLETDCLAPADGVYAGWATVDVEGASERARRYAAAISVGTKPTFGGAARAVEACLLEGAAPAAALDGVPEYGGRLRLEFTAWVRDQMRFGSVGALVEQMARDCARIAELLGTPREWPTPAGDLAACR